MNQQLKKYGYYNSPIGLIEITLFQDQITNLEFVDEMRNKNSNNLVIKNCIAQLEKYFKNQLTTFSFPIAINGTPFQELVWSKTYKIPYGKTISYQELAESVGKPKAIRAVANAIAANKLSLIIACHRVVAADGKNINYRWGSAKKLFLLDLESKN